MKRDKKRRVKLLISIIDKEYEEKLTETIKAAAITVNFSGIGHGTARSSYRNYFGFNEIEKRVVFSLFPEDKEQYLLNAIGRELKLYLLGRGIAFTMPLSGISNIVEDAVLKTPEREDKGARHHVSKKEKSSMHELVVAVVNEKYSDTAIDAARAAGATGATVFHTHSVENAKVEQEMGGTLPEDTNTIFFLTTEAYKANIIKAVRDSAGLKTEGSAVIFSLPVDDIIGIGRFDGSQDDAQ